MPHVLEQQKSLWHETQLCYSPPPSPHYTPQKFTTCIRTNVTTKMGKHISHIATTHPTTNHQVTQQKKRKGRGGALTFRVEVLGVEFFTVTRAKGKQIIDTLLPGVEPGLLDSESNVLTTTLQEN